MTVPRCNWPSIFFVDPSLSGLWAPLLVLKDLTVSASWANDWSISNNYWIYKLQNIGRNKRPWCGGRDVWKWMRLDPKKQSRERAENKVIYNLLSVTKGNQITTHYSRLPRKKKSHGLKKKGMMRFFHEKTFFLDPRPLFFKWSTKS